MRLEDRAHDSESSSLLTGVSEARAGRGGGAVRVSKGSEVTAVHGMFPQSIDSIPRFTEIKGIILILNKCGFYIKHNANVCMNY